MSLGILTASLRTLKNIKTIPNDVVGYVASKIQEDDEDYSHIKKRKSRLQMCLISACVCGIEFCYAAETAFVSPTLLQIGVPVLYMTLIWCLSPLLGFLLVPSLGSLSDRCKFKLGRRRPFILLLSAGILFGLILVPNGRNIGVLLGDKYIDDELVQPNDVLTTTESSIKNDNDTNFNVFFRNLNEKSAQSTPANKAEDNNNNEDDEYFDAVTEQDISPSRTYPHPFSILFTVLGVILLDFSCDACQSPCRAYMLDVTVPEDHSRGLSTFTVLAGLGGACGYVLGGIDWGGSNMSASMSTHVKIVFSMVLVIYLVCVTITVTSFKEVPLEKLGITDEQLQRKRKKIGRQSYKKFTNEDDSDSEVETKQQQQQDYGSQKETNVRGYISQTNPFKGQNTDYGYDQGDGQGQGIGQIPNCFQGHEQVQNGIPQQREEYDTGSYQQQGVNPTKDGTPMPGKEQFYKDEQRVVSSGQPGEMPLSTEVSLKTYLMSIVHMPRSLQILCLTNLFCWMSLVCYSLYFTDFVGQAVFFGDPSAPEGTSAHERYEAGVRMGSLGMSLYSLSCSFYSLSIEKLVAKFGAKKVYICSQLVYTVGSVILALWKHKAAVILLSPTAGVMYATLFTMPYLLVAHYHSNDTFEELVDGKLQRKSDQVRGLGTDIAIVSSMVFFAQFLLSLCMGSLVHMCGSTVVVVWSAAVLSFCGAITATQVLYLDL